VPHYYELHLCWPPVLSVRTVTVALSKATSNHIFIFSGLILYWHHVFNPNIFIVTKTFLSVVI